MNLDSWMRATELQISVTLITHLECFVLMDFCLFMCMYL